MLIRAYAVLAAAAVVAVLLVAGLDGPSTAAVPSPGPNPPPAAPLAVGR